MGLDAHALMCAHLLQKGAGVEYCPSPQTIALSPYMGFDVNSRRLGTYGCIVLYHRLLPNPSDYCFDLLVRLEHISAYQARSSIEETLASRNICIEGFDASIGHRT